MVITTTNTVEGYHIAEYLPTVNTNICVGANIFTDIAASWTDFFNDRSSQYQDKLDKMYQAAVKEITQKAKALKADAVVGLQMHFGSVNISSASRTVFMLSASGTAVKLSDSSLDYGRYDMYRLLHEIKSYLNEGIISQEDYDIEVKRIRADFESKVKRDKANFVYELQKKEEYEQKHESELRIIRNKERKEELIARGVIILKSLNLSNGSYKDIQYINGLSNTDITNSSYEDTGLDGSSMYEDIKELIKMGRYAEACKVYIDNTGLEADDAKEYVVSVYSQCYFTNDSVYKQFSSKLITIMLDNRQEDAIKAFVSTTKMTESEAKNVLEKMME